MSIENLDYRRRRSTRSFFVSKTKETWCVTSYEQNWQSESRRLLVVGMALVDASISLSGRVDLHLRLDAMLPTPELADLISEQVIIERWSGGGAKSLLRWYWKSNCPKTRKYAHVQISVAVQLPTILVPHNIGPWLSLASNIEQTSYTWHIREHD